MCKETLELFFSVFCTKLPNSFGQPRTVNNRFCFEFCSFRDIYGHFHIPMPHRSMILSAHLGPITEGTKFTSIQHSDDICSLSKDEPHCIRQCLKDSVHATSRSTSTSLEGIDTPFLAHAKYETGRLKIRIYSDCQYK